MPQNTDGQTVTMNDALDAWEPVAIAMLTQAAMSYNTVVTYKELGSGVQDDSGIRHNGLLTNWVGLLLGRVISHSNQQRIPQLSALCVKEDGTVGEGYRHSASDEVDPEALTLDELDDHAARTRLDCYRHFGARLPVGGGVATLTPRAQAVRDRKRAQRKKDEPPKLCPSCFTVLPITAQCEYCG